MLGRKIYVQNSFLLIINFHISWKTCCKRMKGLIYQMQRQGLCKLEHKFFICWKEILECHRKGISVMSDVNNEKYFFYSFIDSKLLAFLLYYRYREYILKYLIKVNQSSISGRYKQNNFKNSIIIKELNLEEKKLYIRNLLEQLQKIFLKELNITSIWIL